MLRIFLVAGLASLAIVMACERTTADTESCRSAIEEFDNAGSSIVASFRSYGSCISSSDGHDDCSSEFSQLQSNQDDFESPCRITKVTAPRTSTSKYSPRQSRLTLSPGRHHVLARRRF